MSNGITLTASMRANLYSLQQTSQLMGTIQNRLSTGKKVNSALDNPNNYFAAQSLTNRANDIGALLDGMGQAVQALTAASQGITSAQKVVDQMKALGSSAISSIQSANASTSTTLRTNVNSTASMNSIVTSLTSNAATPVSLGIGSTNSFTITNTTTNAATVVTVNQGETMQQLSDDIKNASSGNLSVGIDSTGTLSVHNNSASATYTFADTTGTAVASMFGATTAGPALVTGISAGATVSADAALNSNNIVAATASTKLYDTTSAATKLVDSSGSSIGLNAGDLLTVKLGTGASATTTSIKVSANNGVDGGVTTLGDLMNKLNSIGGVNASIDSSGKFAVTATDGQTLTLSGALPTDAGLSTVAINSSNAAPASTYSSQFDTLRTQLDQLVKDASYQGINLISGTGNSPLTVVFDEKATSAASLVVSSVDLTTTGLGIAAAGGQWNTAADVKSTLANLTTASATLRDQSASLGTNLSTVQTRQDFATNMINTLKAGSDSLTLADMNEESANMLALQTRSQLGTQALSLANQANQSVMRLFG